MNLLRNFAAAKQEAVSAYVWFSASVMLGFRVNTLFQRVLLLPHTAEKEMARYKALPVLFLRAFDDDNDRVKGFSFDSIETIRTERAISEIVSNAHPFIALGNPKERLPQTGAARTYTDNQNWETYITGYMKSAKIIIVLVSDTKGVRWEIGEIFRNGWNTKTLFLFPHTCGADRKDKLDKLLYDHIDKNACTWYSTDAVYIYGNRLVEFFL